MEIQFAVQNLERHASDKVVIEHGVALMLCAVPSPKITSPALPVNVALGQCCSGPFPYRHSGRDAWRARIASKRLGEVVVRHHGHLRRRSANALIAARAPDDARWCPLRLGRAVPARQAYCPLPAKRAGNTDGIVARPPKTKNRRFGIASTQEAKSAVVQRWRGRDEGNPVRYGVLDLRLCRRLSVCPDCLDCGGKTALVTSRLVFVNDVFVSDGIDR